MSVSSPIESIFFEALQKAAGAQREGFLDQACGGDSVLRSRIERMLRAAEEAHTFLNQPVLCGELTDAQPQSAEAPGTIIGPYKLLQQIGEGGFGVVYMAEQERPVKRRVALKIIKAGMDTRAVIARFEAERQALAMMDHPHIARVLDAGATSTGRPYFVMELVKGIPITEYCDQANLNMRQRLELFMDVCRAVQHAHQKGVIHRDLKPSNIMVTLHDGKAVVKVIDFGIAKATDQKLTEKTLFTHYGQMIGTPAYMSPEQAVMSGLDVDTRSDVYSLGVLLYELLTGSPPFDAQTLRRAGFDEMRRIIREELPPRPSTRLSTLAEKLKLTVAGQRQVSPQALGRQLHGDLDWIVLKALEKDRSRRYESASAFAQDVERHLKDEPVFAGAPSTAYRLRKFVQRNRGKVSAAAAMLVLLIAGTVVSTWQAYRATKAKGETLIALGEKDKALTETTAANAKAIEAAKSAQAANEKAQKRLAQIQKANDLLGSVFDNLDPNEIARNNRPLQAILVEKLDRAVEQLQGEAIGDPLVVAEMQQRLGRSLLGLGEARKAVPLLEKALATHQALLAADAPARLTSLNHLALAYEGAGKVELAVPLLEEALRRWKAGHGTGDEMTLLFMTNLASVYIEAGRKDLGFPLLGEAAKLATLLLGAESEGAITATNNLALAYLHNEQAERALPLLVEGVKNARRHFGPTHPKTIAEMDNLAGAYNAVGKCDLAVSLYEETLKLEKAVLGRDHLDTLTTMSNLIDAYRAAGKLDQAIGLGEETLGGLKVTAGKEHPHTVACMQNLTMVYLDAGKMDLAVPLLEETLPLEKRVFGPDDANTLLTMNNLAWAYCQTGKPQQALSLFEEALKGRRKVLGPQHLQTIRSMTDLADAYHKVKRPEQAIPLYEEALKILEAKQGRDQEETLTVIARLGYNYKQTGRIADAIRLLEESHRAASRFPDLHAFDASLYQCYVEEGKSAQAAELMNEMLAIAPEKSPEKVLLQAGQMATQGRGLLDQHLFSQAETLLRECLTIREKTRPQAWTTFNTQSMLGEALLGQKRYNEAEPLLLAGLEGMQQHETEIPKPAKNRLREALLRLITLYESRGAQGDAQKAERYRKQLQDWKAG